MNEWIKNTGVRPNVGKRAYEVKLRDGSILGNAFEHTGGIFTWVMSGHIFDILEWRFVGDAPADKELTQAEVQQLLHFLRGQLYITSFHKDMQKIDAAELWEECDKKDKFTASSFAAYSQIYTAYKQLKQEEKKLVSLITKLKGLK